MKKTSIRRKMKTTLLAFCITFLLLFPTAEAQPPPPGWHGGENNENPFEEEGHLGHGPGVLLVLGVAYGMLRWNGQAKLQGEPLEKAEP